MTCNVFGGTLNLAQSINLMRHSPAVCTAVSDMESTSLDVAVVCRPCLLAGEKLLIVDTIFKVVSIQ